ncbi:ribosome small subunit-dependent GTPase A [Thermobifida halotolerans]|uniref:ribosome small subunit-dependent GTPase A n=1 Tax=Thermobifida halotolerans TaxID=483545 RepID=UPI000A0645DE|nr:ribosome small subunit-dependent GTPase A [Thermobifida halotolerans]
MSSELTSSPSASGPLAAYGWDASLDAAFADHRAAGLLPCRVTGVDRGRCDIVTEHGPARAVSTPVTSPDPARTVCAGDWGVLRPRSGELPVLEALLPRRSAIVRSTASARSEGQVLAANVDTVAVVEPLTGPVDLARVERLLALAWESGAVPVVVLTKADRHPAPDSAVAEVAAVAPGAGVVAVSAVTGDGLDALTALLTGTVALLGPSGAGKSTLGNALLGADVMATGEVRARDGRGRHTTVRRQLLPLGGGRVLIDTPGLRGVGLWDAAEGLQRAFPEIGELAEECRFHDCSHTSEPGCAVLAAVADGTLPQRRLDSYHKLVRENEWIAARSDARLRAEIRRGHREISRSLRQSYRLRGRKE